MTEEKYILLNVAEHSMTNNKLYYGVLVNNHEPCTRTLSVAKAYASRILVLLGCFISNRQINSGKLASWAQDSFLRNIEEGKGIKGKCNIKCIVHKFD